MNGDEIVFGEMRVREPERRQRPDRDRRLACLAYEVPGPIDLPIFLDRLTADAIERHALSDTSVELGGILLGKECLDPDTGSPFVWITRSLEAKHYANTQASFTYTHDSWEEITRERDRLYPELDIVGWYHTHPSFGIFLSHHDLFIHQHFFAQPLQVAYVVDPINQSRGFFQWRDGGLAQVGGYYLTAERGDRVALARLVNDLEKLPNPEGGGGGTISPRLEAELIKMLNRPAYSPVASPTEKLQIAAVFGMLGTFVGVLAVALALWLYQLQGRMQEQNDSFLVLARSVEQLGENQRLAVDTLLQKGEGKKPADFNELYSKAARERDEALRKLDDLRYGNELLSNRTKTLENRAAEQAAKLEQLTKDAKDAPKLRERIASLEEDNDKMRRRLDDLDPLAKTDLGKQVVDLGFELARTRWAAYIGWGLSVFLGGALVVAFYYYKPFPEAEPEAEAADGERPTHRIV
ncbi:MAG TPA: Mov34/MPN/PAD-1 family protein [Isosphaeraceae bacterium]|nr:Mov34/MPN/PAD-1 family protein [Isosphaeraceae bacterium]